MRYRIAIIIILGLLALLVWDALENGGRWGWWAQRIVDDVLRQVRMI